MPCSNLPVFDDPIIVTEHLFVISPDLKHNNHSVHEVRSLVAEYLKKIEYPVQVMHEFTDGCSAQYKSRHCMGDVSHSVVDFGFTTIRNYFETSHAKGPQDGAGANLKHKADMAVIKRQVSGNYMYSIIWLRKSLRCDRQSSSQSFSGSPCNASPHLLPYIWRTLPLF